MPTAVYVHVPFCRAKCSYCDFVAFAHRQQDIPAWLRQLHRELDHWAEHDCGAPADTVFFGGGTPSLLDPADLAAVIEHIGGAFGIAGGAEISLEANPSSTDPTRAAGWQAAGVNRVSFGVQSFDAERLRLLGRLHGPDGAALALDAAREAGLDNVSLDLIYGLPGHDAATWGAELDAALRLAPRHLSLYALGVEPGTPLEQQVSSGAVSVPDGDMLADCYELAEARLATAGYRHYEISNWALPGHECRHNLHYWRNDDFIGLGPGAWSRAFSHRFAVTSSLDDYLAWPGEPSIRAIRPDLHTTVDAIDATSDARETAMLRLRLDDGLDLAGHAVRFGVSARLEVEAATVETSGWGLLARNGDRLTLTPRGRLLSNDVFQRILVP